MGREEEMEMETAPATATKIGVTLVEVWGMWWYSPTTTYAVRWTAWEAEGKFCIEKGGTSGRLFPSSGWCGSLEEAIRAVLDDAFPNGWKTVVDGRAADQEIEFAGPPQLLPSREKAFAAAYAATGGHLIQAAGGGEAAKQNPSLARWIK